MNEEELLKKSRDALDESVESIDASTLSRLNQARQQALQSKQTLAHYLSTWLPASVAAAAVIAVSISLMPNLEKASDPEILTEQVFDDIDIIASNEELELLEDLEFFGWLIEESDAG